MTGASVGLDKVEFCKSERGDRIYLVSFMLRAHTPCQDRETLNTGLNTLESNIIEQLAALSASNNVREQLREETGFSSLIRVPWDDLAYYCDFISLGAICFGFEPVASALRLQAWFAVLLPDITDELTNAGV